MFKKKVNSTIKDFKKYLYLILKRNIFTDQNETINETINEAINFDLKCIFIAIPKTGTTSVRNQIRQKNYTSPYISNPHLNIMQVRDLIYPYLLRQSLGGNKKFPTKGVISDSEIRNEALNIFNNFYKFSAVRNPWARAISLYFRNEGVETSDKIDFSEFCEKHLYASDTCKHPTLHKNQFDWLSDENGCLLMNYIYKIEEFEKAIIEIAESTKNRVLLKDLRLNSNPKSKSSKYMEMYDERTKKIIQKTFEKDIDYFKYTFKV